MGTLNVDTHLLSFAFIKSLLSRPQIIGELRVIMNEEAMATAKVKMVPKGEWHMNMEFPTSLTLTASEDIRLAAKKLKAGDAKLIDEHKGAEFAVEFTPTKAGKGTVDAKLKFAICIESACSPVTEKMKINFEAK